MKRRSLRCALAFALLLPLSAQAQEQPGLVGKWNVEYEAGRRVDQNGSTPVMGKGVLTISVKGDSLSATMEGGARPDGTPTPPSTFMGKMTDKGATFVQKREGQIQSNGESHPITVTTFWTLQATGDELSGSMKRELPPEIASISGGSGGPTQVKGTRIKG